MRTRTQIRPIGGDATTNYLDQIVKQVIEELQLYSSKSVAVQRRTRGIAFRVRNAPPGQPTGWQWATPQIELPDPADTSMPGYSKGMVIHINSSNSIITDGMPYIGTGATTISQAGAWVAMQDVPAQNGDGQWAVPVNPMPDPDNYDDTSNYWYYLGEQQC